MKRWLFLVLFFFTVSILSSSFVSAVCSDGVKESGEFCDGEDFGGLTCESFGFAGGTLNCNSNCQIELECSNSPVSCSDSDNGKEYNIKGTLSYGNSTFTDFCRSDTELREYFCPVQGSNLIFENRACVFGCAEGVCLAEQTNETNQSQQNQNRSITPGNESVNETIICSDVDGENHFIKGFCNDGSGVSFNDSCLDENTLGEYICGVGCEVKEVDCVNGCLEGVCIERDVEEEISESDEVLEDESAEQEAEEKPNIVTRITSPVVRIVSPVINWLDNLFSSDDDRPYSIVSDRALSLVSEDEVEGRFVVVQDPLVNNGIGFGPSLDEGISPNLYSGRLQTISILDKETNRIYTTSFDSSESDIDQAIQKLASEISVRDSYIVEFDEPPILESSVPSARIVPGAPSPGPSLRETKSQREKVRDLHKRFEKDIEKSDTRGTGNIVRRLTGLVTGKAIDSDSPKIINTYENSFSGVSLIASPEKIEQIKEFNYVKEVYPNTVVSTTLKESVPLIGAPEVWELDEDGNDCTTTGKECLTGKGVTIAIIDTGVDYTHPDLGGCLGEDCKVIGGYDFVNNDDNPMDDQGHGTHVAATAAGKDTNGSYNGVAPDANIVAYKVLDSGGRGYSSDIIAAIEHSVDPNQDGDFSDRLDIISMSLGGFGNPDDPMSKAVDAAVDARVVAVIAAGNSGSRERTIGSPGTARKAITVGATDKNDVIASFSSRGPVVWEDENGVEKVIIKPDIVAPGVSICAAQWKEAREDRKCSSNPDRIAISGTSMATPHVAGLIALLRQKNPDWNPEEMRMALRNTALDINKPITAQGYGRVDVLRATNSNRPLIASLETGGIIKGRLNVKINGTSSGDSFKLYYYQRDEKERVEICRGNGAKKDEVLCDWDLRNLEESTRENPYYHLILVSESEDRKSEDRSAVILINSEITAPEWGVFSIYNNLEIFGTSAGHGFDRYEIELCEDEGNEGDCATTGVNLKNEGTSIVIESLLGTINLENILETGYYKIKLKTHRANGEKETDEQIIYIDTSLVEGFPKPLDFKIFGGGGFSFAFSYMDQPTLVDINDDGKKEIVSSYLNKLYVINSDGKDLEGFPVDIPWTQRGPAVDDINNDGKKEIIVYSGSGEVSIYDVSGNRKYSFYVTSNIGTPTIDDLDNNGKKEIIFTKYFTFAGEGSNIFVYDNKGIKIWDKYLGEGELADSIGGQSTGDGGGDNKKEIIFVVSSCPKRGCFAREFTSQIYALNHEGDVLEGWPKKFNGLSVAPPIIADIIGDDGKEIIFSDYSKMYVFDYGGNVLLEIEHNIEEPFYSIGDLNKDGIEEFIISGLAYLEETGRRHLTLATYDINGNLIGINNKAGIYGYVTHGDLDSNDDKEITLGLYGAVGGLGVKIFDYLSNDVEHKLMARGILGKNVPIGDLEGDGKNEFLAYGWDGNLYAWKSEGIVSENEWNMFNIDPQHTGCYDCPENLTPDTTPPNISVSGAPEDRVKDPVVAEIICEDEESGCNENSYAWKLYDTEVSECSRNPGDYEKNFSVTINKHSWVCAYAEDNAGNWKFSGPVEFLISPDFVICPDCIINDTFGNDVTPPVVNIEYELRSLLVKWVSATVTCNDENSGCNESSFHFKTLGRASTPGEVEQKIAQCNDFSDYEQGSSFITFGREDVVCAYAMDNAGNRGVATAHFVEEVITNPPRITNFFAEITLPGNARIDDIITTDVDLEVDSGSVISLEWEATENPSCVASKDWSGAKSSSGSERIGTIEWPDEFAYTLTCSNSAGSDSKSLFISTKEPAPDRTKTDRNLDTRTDTQTRRDNSRERDEPSNREDEILPF